MRTARLFLDLGGSIFLLLGALHTLYTFLDIGRPRRLVPREPEVALAMANSVLRLSRGGTTMWRAWVGFNFSHGLGLILFGALCIGTGMTRGHALIPAWVLFSFVVIGSVYVALGALYWFRIPLIGVALGTISLLVAWVVYAFGGV
jgi:hypothetical protein